MYPELASTKVKLKRRQLQEEYREYYSKVNKEEEVNYD